MKKTHHKINQCMTNTLNNMENHIEFMLNLDILGWLPLGYLWINIKFYLVDTKTIPAFQI